MIVVVIRHGTVNYRWSRYCSSRKFDQDWNAYNQSPLLEEAYTIPETVYQDVYTSTLSRSRDTAKRLLPRTNPIETDWIDEVPIHSSFDTERKLPLWFWSVTGGLQWLFNHPRQAEGYRHTRERARKFVAMLCKKGVDSLVVTHSFYMHTLLSEMRRNGFRTDKSRVVYGNGEYVVATRGLS